MRPVKTAVVILGLFLTRALLANEMPGDLGGATAETAPGHLSEIPEEWLAAFSGIEPDPHPEKLTRDSHYWVSDEQRHDLFRESIANAGGIFIGLGTDQNYLMAAWSRPEVLIPLDFDQMIVNLHLVYRVIFLNAESPEAFVQMWQEEEHARTRALIKQAYQEMKPQALKDILRAFKVGSRFVRRKLNRIARQFRKLGVPTFLSDAGQYRYIREMFQTNRVFPVRGDLTARKTVKQVAAAAAKVGLPVRTLYLSNAEQYFKFPPQYRENMLALPMDDRSVVIRTAGTKKPWTADGVYDYIVQRGDNFKAWIRHKRTYNVWTIVQARKVNKKTGLSRVESLPKE